MKNIQTASLLCMNLSVVATALSKKLDVKLSTHGINFTEYLILYHLEQAVDSRMRRIDLADLVGISASGITRLVGPMEKIGLVAKEANARDARVSLVKLTDAGLRILTEATETVNNHATDLIAGLRAQTVQQMLENLTQLGGHIQ